MRLPILRIRLCLQKLDALEKEEEMRERAGVYDSDTSDDEEAIATRKIADKYAKNMSSFNIAFIHCWRCLCRNPSRVSDALVT